MLSGRFVFNKGNGCIVDNDGLYEDIPVGNVDYLLILLNNLNEKNRNCVDSLDCIENVIEELRLKYRDSFFKLSVLDEIVMLKREG